MTPFNIKMNGLYILKNVSLSYVIHNDLNWNPNDTEQRTGRIDRLWCKAKGKHPILIYMDLFWEDDPGRENHPDRCGRSEKGN